MKNNDVNQSPAFHEFIQKRSDEITSADKTYIEMNRKILDLEEEILSALSGDIRKKFAKYEKLVSDLEEHTGILLYRQGFTDSKHF